AELLSGRTGRRSAGEQFCTGRGGPGSGGNAYPRRAQLPTRQLILPEFRAVRYSFFWTFHPPRGVFTIRFLIRQTGREQQFGTCKVAGKKAVYAELPDRRHVEDRVREPEFLDYLV